MTKTTDIAEARDCAYPTNPNHDRCYGGTSKRPKFSFGIGGSNGRMSFKFYNQAPDWLGLKA
jgi:hypothetical protein